MSSNQFFKRQRQRAWNAGNLLTSLRRAQIDYERVLSSCNLFVHLMRSQMRHETLHSMSMDHLVDNISSHTSEQDQCQS